MKYLKNEIELLQRIEFRENIQEAVNNILDGYNKVYITAVRYQEFVKRKETEYAEEMEESFKLKDRNTYLEDENKRYKSLYKDQILYIQKLEKELRMTNKLLAIQNESNSNK